MRVVEMNREDATSEMRRKRIWGRQRGGDVTEAIGNIIYGQHLECIVSYCRIAASLHQSC